MSGLSKKNTSPKAKARLLKLERAFAFVDTSQQAYSFASNIGNHIRSRREQKKLTQAELATASQIDRSYLSQVEKGKRRISLEVAHRIATALGCTVEDLING